MPTPSPPWYRTITRQQWNALLAAKLGWMLDAMDFVLYVMAISALREEFGFAEDVAGLLGTGSPGRPVDAGSGLGSAASSGSLMPGLQALAQMECGGRRGGQG